MLLASTASGGGSTVSRHVARATAGPPVTQFDVGETSINSPTKIAAGSDGNIWFVDDNNNGYGKITTAGTVTEWTWDNASDGVNRGLSQIAVDAGGNAWFGLCPGSLYVPSIAKVTPAGVFTAYTPNTYGHFFAVGCPRGITAGSDGNMWFTDSNYVGKITSSGQITEYDVLPSYDVLGHIVVGPDGDLWATDTEHDLVAQISTAGALVKLYQLPSDRGVSGIVVGPDHNLWLTEPSADMIGRLTTAGVLTEFPTGANFAQGDDGVIAGPDGNLWFTECASGDVAKITTAGVVSQHLVNTGQFQCPNGIAAGSDGNIWFADEGAGQIDRVSPNWVPPQCVVPTVVGRKVAAAKAVLRAAKCSVGRVKSVFSKKARGKVVSQSPKPGATLAQNAKINLVVSKGKKK
ncbi:MAG TPA: PASTA domain-containing protein [Gaiellaceae bacterium]|nr:PASTA domain-containing protein [Gaiellaceae bacterium]